MVVLLIVPPSIVALFVVREANVAEFALMVVPEAVAKENQFVLVASVNLP